MSRTIGNTSPIELMCARATSKVPASGRAALSFGSLKVIAALTDAMLGFGGERIGIFYLSILLNRNFTISGRQS